MPNDAAASKDKLAGFLEAVDIPIVVVDHDLSIAWSNQAAWDALGLSLADSGLIALGARFMTAAPRLEQLCRQVVANGLEARADIRHGDAWFVVRASPYRNHDRQLAGTVLTFTNVTAFRACVDQAVYERECTKAIINAITDPLVVLSADQRVRSGNRAFYTMFGLSRDQTEGVPIYKLGDGALGIGALREQLDDMLRGARSFQPVEVAYVDPAKGQRVLVLDAQPLSFPGHAERRILVTFQDITARKQAQAAKDLRSEEELRRSEASLAEGQRLSLTGSFSWNVASDTITWSEQMYRIFGFEIGTPVTVDLVRTRVHPEDISLIERMKMFDAAHAGSGGFEWQYRLMMPDGSIKYLHAIAHATRDAEGRPEYIAAVQDVTARHHSEEALAKARAELAKVARVNSLGVLTASIAHEVNQPLSGIITNASTCLRMLSAEPPNVEGARETARRTIRDGSRAADVITRLRTLYSRKRLLTERMDLNEVVRDVTALTLGELQRNGVVVHHELADDLPYVTADRVQIQQVILNLLRNASDAMSTVDDRTRELVIRTEWDGAGQVRFSVSDTGVGFGAQVADKLFEAFYTTKGDGMGIGLSISRSIIDAHHGRLWATVNDGPGATFSFALPTQPEGAPKQ